MKKYPTPAWMLLAATLTAGAAAAQDLDADLRKARQEIAQAKKDVQKTEAEIRKTDSLLREEAVRAQQSEERQARDRERREKENAALQERIRATQAKIDAERSGLARHQNAIDEVKARQRHLTLVLAGYCDSVAARIASGLPWDADARLDRVRALKKDLEAGAATPDEGFTRLSALLKEEVKGGDEIAVLNKPVTRKNGDVVNAQVLKIGNQWLVYMDEDGKHFGILERQSGPQGPVWAWREDPGFTEKNMIKSALEVKSAKRPPQLVTLTLGIAPPGAVTGGAAQSGKKGAQ